MNVCIVGCGLIGMKRLRSLRAGDRLIVAADPDLPRAQALARAAPGAVAVSDWSAAVGNPEVDLVIVATTNDALAPVSIAAVENGKHVIVEKPAARTASELDPLIAAARRHGRSVHVGFNLRYHPAFLQARRIVDSGALGPLMFLRARYGHGGRPGYEKEWRAKPAISGGGELIDQGVHLIDLSRWFLGDFTEVDGHVATCFWPMEVDDNAFLLLRTPEGRVAWLHASCTEWKNTFCFELYGKHGKLQVDGLGGSYGVERLAYYRMLPEMGPPETTIWEYPGEDTSWRTELEAVAVNVTRGDISSLMDAYAALRVVERVYSAQGAATGSPV